MAKDMAAEIVAHIKPELLYSEGNTTYPLAPKALHLANTELIKNFILDTYAIREEEVELVMLKRDMGNSLLGLYQNVNGVHYIMINSAMNLCKTRFATVKELCSMYVDHYDTRNGFKRYDDYYNSLVNALEQKRVFIDKKVSLDDGDLDSELFSLLLTIELMIPATDRTRIFSLLDQIKDGTYTYNDIAKTLLIPEFILEIYDTKYRYL